MILINRNFKKTCLVEVVPTNSATNLTWTFPDNPFLRDKVCVGLMLSINPYTAVSGKTNISVLLSQGLYSCFLTLTDSDNVQFVQNLPVVELSQNIYIDTANNDYYAINSNGAWMFAPRVLQWNKCFVYFPIATALANYSLQLQVIYQ